MESIRAARELITEGRYDEAREILENSDHLAAEYWLCKLERLDPTQKTAPQPVELPAKTALAGVFNRLNTVKAQ